MGLSEYISKTSFVQRIILSKRQLSEPGVSEDSPNISAPFENDPFKAVHLLPASGSYSIRHDSWGSFCTPF